jgi:hypothetical protein
MKHFSIYDHLLTAVKLAYRKHCLGDDSIGWDELDKFLHNTLCEVMGDEEYQKWLEQVSRSIVNAHGK